eukprot:scaffold7566_cov122-Isochrysis_galbana.AAC.9
MSISSCSSDHSAASQPPSQDFSHSTPSRQSGMVQPVIQEMFATVHAAGSSLFGLFSSCSTLDSTFPHKKRGWGPKKLWKGRESDRTAWHSVVLRQSPLESSRIQQLRLPWPRGLSRAQRSEVREGRIRCGRCAHSRRAVSQSAVLKQNTMPPGSRLYTDARSPLGEHAGAAVEPPPPRRLPLEPFAAPKHLLLLCDTLEHTPHGAPAAEEDCSPERRERGGAPVDRQPLD